MEMAQVLLHVAVEARVEVVVDETVYKTAQHLYLARPIDVVFVCMCVGSCVRYVSLCSGFSWFAVLQFAVIFIAFPKRAISHRIVSRSGKFFSTDGHVLAVSLPLDSSFLSRSEFFRV